MAHAHAHNHPPGPAAGADRSSSRRALTLTLVLTSAFTLAEVIGGLLTGSLALLADAAHMLSDDLSLGIALFAVWLAQRPATAERTFGYKRAEILAALFNGVTLVAISIWIFIEAGQRFGEPHEILGAPMLVVAFLGLAVNLVAARILHGGGDDSLNVSAALRHVLADLAGSVGVIIAAVVILLTGWEPIDPLISILIGLLVLGSSWGILRDSVHILLEGTPPGMDAPEVAEAITSTEGVVNVHDLHVWTITSGFPSLAAHVLVEPETDCHATRRELETMLASRFDLEHTTLQVDHREPAPLLQIEGAKEAVPRADAGHVAEHTFLFADIAGFTALTERRGDERAAEIVDDFQGHVTELLSRYGGEQVKSIGDAVMLRFDEAAAAIQLGLDLAHHEMARPDHPAIRIGIHRGPAIERDGDWLGATVNVAARVASLARADEILVTASAFDTAGPLPRARVIERVAESLRNVEAPVEVVRVSCAH